MTGLSPTSKLTVRAAGAPFPKLLDFSVAAKAAVSAGLIFCAPILNAATSLSKRMSSFIIKLHSLLGNKWSLIAGRLPGRTDNEIKNYWNTHIRRKLLSRGIDPLTHRPINEPAVDVAAISFGGVLRKEEMMNSGFGCKSRNPDEENCPDLNLELRISPPHQHPSQPALESRERRMLCFYCSLGLEKSKECSCSSRGGNGSSDDFLGMKNGVLDYRYSEMKRD